MYSNLLSSELEIKDNKNMKGKDLSDPNWVDFLLITIFLLMVLLQLYKMGVLRSINKAINPPQEQEVNY